MAATATKERPIVCHAHEVRSILDGRRTMLRRVVKPQPPDGVSAVNYVEHSFDKSREGRWSTQSHPEWIIDCPFGGPGSVLWCRETFQIGHNTGESSRVYTVLCPTGSTDRDGMVFYRADNHPDVPSWRSSTAMPRWASRLTLELTAVRVERLQDISEADAVAEGCVRPVIGCALDNFYRLWDEINGEGSWQANPWCWVLSFVRCP